MTGPFGSCLNRQGSFCDIVLIPDEPEVCVLEDLSADARFSAHPNVVGAPFLRFYAGAPLVGSSGLRYGTLCVLDVRPRSFPASLLSTLVNFAELVTRELELGKEIPTRLKHLGPLVRSSETCEEPVALVDLSKEGWPLMYCNAAWAKEAAIPSYQSSCQPVDPNSQEYRTSFWDLFEAIVQEDIDRDVPAALQALKPAKLRVRRKGPAMDLVGDVTVVLRPASDSISSTVPVGIPGFVPFEGVLRGASMGPPGHLTMSPNVEGSVDNLWFATLRGAESPRSVYSTSSRSQRSSLESSKRSSMESQRGTPRGVVADTRQSSEASLDFGTSSWKESMSTNMSATASRSPSSQPRKAVVPKEFHDVVSLPGLPQIHEGKKMSAASRLVGPSPREMLPFNTELPERYKDMQLGPLLGVGSFARVHRAVWRGHLVAVKMIELPAESVYWPQLQCAIAEGTISSELRHSNIVGTIDTTHFRLAINPFFGTDPSGCINDQPYTRPLEEMDCVWIVQEICDRGKLADALDRGWLRNERSQDSPPHLPTLLRTAADIASALGFLHSRGIIHGDLTYNNVLLQSNNEDPRGFIAKVGDFGLSKLVQETSIRTNHVGTVSHLPPELLSDGIMDFYTDIYSLGVLIWEMWTGVRAWCGQRPAQIVLAVTTGKGKLELPADAPAQLRDLVSRCVNEDRYKRPNAGEVWVELQAMLLFASLG